MFDSVLPFFMFAMGAIWGSFANVVIYRLPKKESVVFPSSHCQSCHKKIFWFDNIPILSWFILRGKCRYCAAPFSMRYPLVELVMALLFLGVYLKLGLSWTLLEYLIFIFALVTACVIDIDHYILPDVFTLSGIVIGLLGALLNPERHFIDAVGGVLMGGGFLWAIAYFYYILRKQEGMGGGDIKLLAWIGAVLGWSSIPFVIMSASILGSILGLLLASNQKKGMQTVIPFGPYLAFGAALYIFYGQTISSWYWKIFFPQL